MGIAMSADTPLSGASTWIDRSPAEMDPRLLEQGETHLFLLPLIEPESVVEELAATLTPDEHERARRFKFDRDRRRFLVARGRLRQCISRYTGMPADAIRFDYGPFGKPHLSPGANQMKLEFSLSHSEDWALAGFARGRAIGVDLEAIRAIIDYKDLAESTFAPAETDALLKLPADRQIDGFFACWTRKEAYVKALGLGFSLDLSSFTVRVDPNEGVETIAATQTAAAHRVWGGRPLAGYWAAVALEEPAPASAPAKIRLSTYSGLAT
jgi:4'-phosphopantetheinyl transferase